LGRRDLALAPDPRTGFEMTLLRMLAFRPVGGSAERVPAAVTAAPTNAAASGVTAVRAASQRPLTTVAASSSGASAVLSVDNWLQVIAALDVGGAARQLAQNCGFVAETANVVTLALDPRNAHMATAAQHDRLAQALGTYLGRSVRIEFTQAAPETPTASRARERAEGERFDNARKSLDSDPTVQAIKERFGATLLEESVRPAKP
jgi:DNA polymerase III subunit gamma/tau